MPTRRPTAGTLVASLGLALAFALGGAACTTPEGRPPIARITLSPEAILSGDEFQTAVTVDGTRSGDPVDDPDGERPLTYAWRIVGDEYRLESGTEESPMYVVRFRGDRPATIELTVADEDGLDAIAVTHVQLTVR